MTEQESRILETAKILERLQEVGYILCCPKGGYDEFPMPYSTGWKITTSLGQSTLIIDGDADRYGGGLATMSIDFSEDSITNLMKAFKVYLVCTKHEYYKEACRFAERLLWLDVVVEIGK